MMNTNQENLVKNLSIFATMAVVITILMHFMMPDAGIDSLLIGGLSFSVMLWFPVRLFPSMHVFSFITLGVIVVLYIAFVQFLGDIGAILAFVLLMASLIGSFFVL